MKPEVIILETEGDKAAGLKGVTSLPWNTLLFFVDVAPGTSFTTIDCHIDIDIMPIDDQGRILSLWTAIPGILSVGPMPPGTRHVVEANGGWARKNKFYVGSKLPVGSAMKRGSLGGFNWQVLAPYVMGKDVSLEELARDGNVNVNVKSQVLPEINVDVYKVLTTPPNPALVLAKPRVTVQAFGETHDLAPWGEPSRNYFPAIIIAGVASYLLVWGFGLLLGRRLG